MRGQQCYQVCMQMAWSLDGFPHPAKALGLKAHAQVRVAEAPGLHHGGHTTETPEDQHKDKFSSFYFVSVTFAFSSYRPGTGSPGPGKKPVALGASLRLAAQGGQGPGPWILGQPTTARVKSGGAGCVSTPDPTCPAAPLQSHGCPPDSQVVPGVEPEPTCPGETASDGS